MESNSVFRSSHIYRTLVYYCRILQIPESIGGVYQYEFLILDSDWFTVSQ